ncbi:uncharacterized protein LOC117908725 [Vitis riparia]|uniref:uncharacterized protein LOC117908725 n=1 Tax=Vitis riparia TaxID=96939 RepID=UPI00155A58A8|nr:uncharacterized protein LOC117908725 [Vitis riparia]XP_034678304.1 uncharacterized protein LOC117908725 [Vitis riparia]XP_034678305.1 uncharacterized protein LOC117908725 [Vitis riparia]
MSNGAVGDSRWQSMMMAKRTGDNKYGDGFRMMEVVSTFCICATRRHILGQPFSKPQDTRRGYSTLPNSYLLITQHGTRGCLARTRTLSIGSRRADSGFLEWGMVSRGTKQHGMCGKDYQLAMVVVEGGDVFTGPRVVKLVVAYRRRKK